MEATKVTVKNLNDPFLGRKKKYQLRVQAVKNYIADNPGAAITLEDFKKIAHYKGDMSAHTLIKTLLEDKEIFRSRIPRSNKFSYWTSSIPSTKVSGLKTTPSVDEPSAPPKPVPASKAAAKVREEDETAKQQYNLTFVVSKSNDSITTPKVSIELNNVDINSIESIVETAVEQL